MNINFNSDGFGKKNTSSMTASSFEDMLKKRKKILPEVQETIQELLKDYSGESIAILIMREDENGMPAGEKLLIAGVARMETQMKLAAGLDNASHKAFDLLLDATKGDVRAMMQIAKHLTEDIVNDIKKER